MQLRDRFDGLTVVVAADDAEALRALAHADAACSSIGHTGSPVLRSNT